MKFSTHAVVRPLAPGLLFVLLALGGCFAPEDDGIEPDPAQDDPGQLNEAQYESPPTVDEKPVASFELPDGATIRFYAHEDGSASIEEEGDAYHAAVSSRPEFTEATIFDVYHALGGAG